MELKIDKLIYGGNGLAHRQDGKAVFIPFVIEDERVQAEVVEEKPGFARASLLHVIEPSPARAVPPCPYYGACGGCHYQHMSYEHQLVTKREILRETLRRTGKLDWAGEITVHSGEPLQYRNRTRVRVRHQPGFAIGYNRFGSHALLPIDQCPISSPLINRAIHVLLTLGHAGVVPEDVAEVQFFADAKDERLAVELFLSAKSHASPDLKLASAFADQLRLAFASVTAVHLSVQRSVHPAAAGEPLDLESSGAPLTSLGEPALIYRTAEHGYKVSGGAFFQVNRFLVDRLTNLVCHGEEGELALDLYAGVGLFAAVLARNFSRVIAVEASPVSFQDLRANCPSGVEAVRSTTEEHLYKAQVRGNLDFAILDPPRAGVGERAIADLARLASRRITYVSCDSSTLARDLRVLIATGYKVREVHVVDLFPQTFHIESVIKLSR